MKLRLMLRFSSSFSGLSSSAVLLQLLAVVVLIRLPSFADGIKCVQCGYEHVEPCGQTLPPETDCKAEHKSCTLGAHVSKTTGVETETRQCTTQDAVFIDHQSKGTVDGTLHQFFCGTDGCNKDQSSRPPPPQRPAPPATPQQCPRPPPEGGPLKCVECGWTFGKACGDKLPPATQCKDAKHKTCATGVHVDVNAGQVQEIRACVGSDFGGLLDKRPLLGDKCETAGCNGERHPSDADAQDCPSDGDVDGETDSPDGGETDSPDGGETDTPDGDGEAPPDGGDFASSSSPRSHSSSSLNQRLLCWMLAAFSLLFGLVVFRFNSAASL